MPNQAADLYGVPILVVEQDAFCAAYVAHGLRDAGARLIGPCASAAEVLARLRRGRPPEAAVLGGTAAEGDSCRIADALAGRDIPFVVINHPHGTEPAPACRGRPLFSKPFGAFQIVEAVEQLAAGRH